MPDVWADGSGYEAYIGRWSRSVAREFLRPLAVPPDAVWLDFGCGTGALSQTILTDKSPKPVIGCDRSTRVPGGDPAQTADRCRWHDHADHASLGGAGATTQD